MKSSRSLKMDSSATRKNQKFKSIDDISDNGERVSHLNQDCVYYAHLSLYDFAKQFCKNALILDAGCGSGYGTAYLADSGAQHVWGIDASAKAIEFSRYHFQRSNLSYQEMKLEDIQGFTPNYFDFIYTSNTLEHVPDVVGFMRKAWQLLKPTGTMLIAVPPITDDRLEYLNIINPYHINIWSPHQWMHVIGTFFNEIRPVLHGVEKMGKDFKPEHFTPDSKLTEKSFVFTPSTVDDMYKIFTLTAIFVVKNPRPENQVPDPNVPLTFIDDSFSRSEGYIDPAVRQKLKRYFDMPSPPYISPNGLTKEKSTLKRIVKKMLAFLRVEKHK
jgi:2-polyprenyl-3-methyl-5-hydroxy-6-metoxy-1,4-benzoquinol methylase